MTMKLLWAAMIVWVVLMAKVSYDCDQKGGQIVGYSNVCVDKKAIKK